MITIEGNLFIDFTSRAKTYRGAIRAFRRRYPGAGIRTVAGRDVIAMCEICGDPILEDEPRRHYQYDDEGTYWHRRCWPEN